MGEIRIEGWDGRDYALNSGLLKQKGISKKAFSGLVNLHRAKNGLFRVADMTRNLDLLPLLAKELTQIEYDLQELWGFPLDDRFHEWYLMPRCTCPKTDNLDMRGINRQIMSCDCIVHGKGN